MEVIKFTLNGRFAFFKKPDVNTYFCFSYGSIHKVALLGIFGAILGYKGYNQMSFSNKYKKDFKGLIGDNESCYPEFYEKLNHLRIAVVPYEVSINKKVQVFNNSVGYASREQGGNLIVKEQWLENPSWDVYIAVEDKVGRMLAKSLINKSFVYIPYLGKNDHLADIKNVELMSNINETDTFNTIESLFIKDDFQIVKNDGLDDLYSEDITKFKYEEKLPICLDKTTNKYELKSFIYTNENLVKTNNTPVYKVSNKNIVFI